MKRLIYITIALFACTLTSGAQENVQLVLTVDVTNGTTNGKSVSGDEVIINILEHGKLVDKLQGKVGDDGKAIFKDIPTLAHLAAHARVLHEGMSFSGRGIELKPQQRQVNTHVEVFDVSFDNSLLSVITHHLKIRQEDNHLVLSEFLLLRNPSDMAITSNEKDSQNNAIVLTISLPKGFKNFTCLFI